MEKIKIDWKTIAKEKLNFNPEQCPVCKKATLKITTVYEAVREPPPKLLIKLIDPKDAF